MIDFSTDKLYDSLLERPHVCILGAGASVATIPEGDKNGIRCPVMNNAISTLRLEDIVAKADLKTKSTNLEDVYSEMSSRPDCELLLPVLENRVRNYFAGLILPDVPTIYDYLLLSLRGKDFVFTFNWDPLLVQAYHRVSEFTDDLPTMGFLHGNTAVGVCSECHQSQDISNKFCVKCGKQKVKPSKLLYPVKEKTYCDDIYIKTTWESFLHYLSGCTLLTIFGYGAPASDKKAKEAMEMAYASNFRRFDKIEIINILPRQTIYDTWDPFFDRTNYKYDILDNFWASSLAKNPRRTVEEYCNRIIANYFGPTSPKLKKCNTLTELGNSMLPLFREEREGIFKPDFNR